jgi:Ca2+-binding EF-hand superfamily protein
VSASLLHPHLLIVVIITLIYVIDVDLEGFVTSKEIKEVFKQCGAPINDADFKDMITMADYNSNNPLHCLV